jgi:hypothetical protein
MLSSTHSTFCGLQKKLKEKVAAGLDIPSGGLVDISSDIVMEMHSSGLSCTCRITMYKVVKKATGHALIYQVHFLSNHNDSVRENEGRLFSSSSVHEVHAREAATTAVPRQSASFLPRQ